MFRTATVLVVAGCAAALTACSSTGDTSSTKQTGVDSAQTKADARAVNVTVTAANCCVPDSTSLAAGGVTVNVTNKDATAVSEVEILDGARIIGEKENLPPGFSGTFAVNVTAGKYTLYCPGATPERSTMTVTGKAAPAGNDAVSVLLAQGTKGYASYVRTQVAALQTAVGKLDAALHGTKLAAAQAAYMRARPYYEKIEPVAESFLALDTAIDARADGVSADKFTGFHRIEKGLFADKSLTGLDTFGTQLVANVKQLAAKTATLTYQPTELANGAQGLLDEVAANKITGEEERYSHIDLLDFANNDEGAEQAFAQLQPALEKIDPVLSKTIQTRFAALDDTLNTYRTGANPSGFRLYTELTSADKRALAAAVKAVQEPLSNVASKVAAG